MKRSFLAALIATTATCFSASAFAQLACNKTYGFQANDVTAGTTGSVLCSSTSSSFFDALGNFSLSNASYNGNDQVSIYAKFNDVNLNLWYPAAGVTSLHFSSPELGIGTIKFVGSTRDESQQLFKDYIKKNNIIGQIMAYQAKNSATSPITGVGGLIPMSIASDFDSAFTGSATAVAASPQSSSTGNNNLVGMGLNYGSYNVSQSADRVKTTTLPLSYVIRNDMDPRRQLSFSLPITQVNVGGAMTYHAGLGVGYRIPMNDHWTLTPGGRYSVVASRDRATLSSVYSFSLTSAYVMPHDGYDVAIGNMLGYYRTGKFASGEYSFDPGIKNIAARNGVMISQPFSGLGKRMSIEYSLIDTRYFGDKPFLSSYQEIGVTLGTSKSALDARSYMRAGLSYMTGKNTHGFNVNLGYWF
jgi:hypothetical protein